MDYKIKLAKKKNSTILNKNYIMTEINFFLTNEGIKIHKKFSKLQSILICYRKFIFNCYTYASG